jgi:hypothetical protein
MQYLTAKYEYVLVMYYCKVVCLRARVCVRACVQNVSGVS